MTNDLVLLISKLVAVERGKECEKIGRNSSGLSMNCNVKTLINLDSKQTSEITKDIGTIKNSLISNMFDIVKCLHFR